ncbi:PdxA family dehydrogenase [Salinisphaera orenii]|uniref:Terephthalate dihydrodiol dehydrogenase n=1 Tax=Salinisphaera orenii YIM 95161 TaxID=1051139 RepID=A0A423PTW6_9GAMM|nr:4-hydroxythreonine-4-phosphate dehydrogenase PdxA [Salinisphaera halophila]ROO28972.1 terephthalate dihydrodiol dehydrogenase [Salinisphaera halophila YIM 95161]
MSAAFVVAVPIGDPNGIGPEIAIAAAQALAAGSPVRAVLVGDAHVLEHYAAAVGVALRRWAPGAPLSTGATDTVDMVDVAALPAEAFRPGDCGPASGAATVAYLKAAIELTASGDAQAIVGCPHHEGAVNASGTPFQGYPALLGELTHAEADSVILMLEGGGFRIAHVTLHESVVNAVTRVNEAMVVRAAEITLAALARRGIDKPRLGIFGINPHAGENGLFGHEDEQVTRPAVARLKQAGHRIEGPLGADLMLSEDRCDGYVAMFHDQGHIPIKLLAQRESVAYSLGADFMFASVGHGSAPDIAGQGKADHRPLLATLNAIAGNVAA